MQRTTIEKTISIILIALLYFSCTRQPPVQKLKQSTFSLSFQAEQKIPPLTRVKDIKQDGLGNLYLLDVDKKYIYKFDPNGRFLNLLCGPGYLLGQLDRAVSIHIYRDSLLLVHNQSVVDVLTIQGKPIREVSARGRGDISVRNDGTVFINRMMDATQWGYLIQTIDLQGNELHQFKPARGPFYKTSQADFSFVGHLSNNRVVYVPALLDSIFLYDVQGRLLKSAVRVDGVKPPADTDQQWPFQVEDLCVHNDRIFLLPADKTDPNSNEVYFKKIAEYNADLKLVKIYELPESITVTTTTEPWAPWYHRFLVTDSSFLFMVAKPAEHIEAYEY